MSGPGLELPATDPRAAALRLIRAPAFFLLCVGVLAVLFNLGGVVLIWLKIPSPLPRLFGQEPVAVEFSLEQMLYIFSGVICGILSIWGALSAMNLKGYGLVYVGAITAAFCVSPTACIGIPVMCWMLFTLSRPEVRKAFAA
jgi:hypothetical protein